MRAVNHIQLAGSLFPCLLACAILSVSASAQTTATNQWTWVGGSSAANRSGVYGTIGKPAAGNVPGSRWYAANWTDSSGNLWLLGGDGYDANGQESELNDFWKFDPNLNQWTWMGGNSTIPCYSWGCGGYPGLYGAKGTPSSTNAPGSRTAATSWTDYSGNLWLFGGDGIDASGLPDMGWLNDLWEYNPASNQWTWVSGDNQLTCVWALGGYCGAPGAYTGAPGAYVAGNLPAGRFGATGWTGNTGDLWLFGGMSMLEEGVDTYLNDLWKFNPDTQQWIWMGGSSATPCPVGIACSGPSGVYGTLGTPDAANIPGAREFAANWIDTKGNLWLFGGQGMVAGGGNYLNDLWEFTPSTNMWTWRGGSNSVYTRGGAPGVYGIQGTPAPGNIPGAREYASSWVDDGGNFWLFGGLGFDANGSQGNLNDLWEFNLCTNQWAWISGSKIAGSTGVYSASQTLAAPKAVTNGALATTGTGLPASRMNGMNWTDKSGNLWLFGGSGGSNSYLNDLWKFQPASSTGLVADFSFAASISSLSVTAGHAGTTSITVTPQNGFNSAVSFTCSGLPFGASCSFSPATVTPSGAASSTTLTVTTSASMAALHRKPNPFVPAFALAIGLCWFGRKARRLQMLLVLAASLFGLGVLNGCGGGSPAGGSNSVQASTSTVTVVASSGTLQHTATFLLTVN